jgi:hypothetical protein
MRSAGVASPRKLRARGVLRGFHSGIVLEIAGMDLVRQERPELPSRLREGLGVGFAACRVGP